MRTRSFVLAGLVVTLLVAGGLSYYASSHPDALERVAQQAGFAETAERSAAEESPLAGYGVRGVEDARLSGGLAGVVGAVVVLLLAGGLGYAVRRRGPAQRGTDPAQPGAGPTAGPDVRAGG